jgi:hypothetical protein
MKPYKQIDATRAAYHEDPERNSVHRSSLLVPTMENTDVEISFLNHFLIKRNYANVACRVTAVDSEGMRIEARLFPITEPKVYTLPLSRVFGAKAVCFLVDFFAANNLFIPFPAVMINHRGEGFVNVVHSYNRVLNDVFENDEINWAAQPIEASIDADCSDQVSGFCLIASGIYPVKGDITLDVMAEDERLEAVIPVDIPRLNNHLINYRDLFEAGKNGTLRIHQPPQEMFYSRLFSGRHRADGVFTANHSYYDSSVAPEYWNDQRASYRAYPYFPNLNTRIRAYPVMAPGTLSFDIGFHKKDGTEITRVSVGELQNPNPPFLEARIDNIVSSANLDPSDVGTFIVYATPTDGNTPTRINHQLLYGDELFSSINISLKNDNNFAPNNKAGLTWGQAVSGGASDGYLGITGDNPSGPDAEVDLTIYDINGKIAQRTHCLPSGGSIIVDLEKELGRKPEAEEDGNGTNYWYVARSSRTDLTAISLSHHISQKQFTGEHGF